MAECPSSGMSGHVLSPKIAPSLGAIWAHIYKIHGSLGPPESTTQTASRSVHSAVSRKPHGRESLDTLQGPPLYSPYTCPFPLDIWTPSSFRHTRVSPTNSISFCREGSIAIITIYTRSTLFLHSWPFCKPPKSRAGFSLSRALFKKCGAPL